MGIFDSFSSLKDKVTEKFGNKLNAKTAYQMSAYGIVAEDVVLMNRLIKHIDWNIKSRTLKGKFSLIIDLEDNFLKDNFKKVIEYYQKLGFCCKYLSKDVEGLSDLTEEYLLISWNKEEKQILEENIEAENQIKVLR